MPIKLNQNCIFISSIELLPHLISMHYNGTGNDNMHVCMHPWTVTKTFSKEILNIAVF